MAIYRQGKKITGLHRNGKAFTGVYRNGKKLWDKGEPMPIYGIELVAQRDADELDLRYALNTVNENQRDYYVDVMLGTKVLRLAGNTVGRATGIYKDGVLTWGNVSITDEDIYIGKLIDFAVVYGASETLYSEASYPEKDRAIYDFNGVNLSSESYFVAHVRAYNNVASDAMAQLITVDGERVSNSNEAFPEFEQYTYTAKGKYSAGTYKSATMKRGLARGVYNLFYNSVDVKDEVTYKNLVATRQNEVKIVTPAAHKIIQLKVKGIIR